MRPGKQCSKKPRRLSLRQAAAGGEREREMAGGELHCVARRPTRAAQRAGDQRTHCCCSLVARDALLDRAAGLFDRARLLVRRFEHLEHRRKGARVPGRHDGVCWASALGCPDQCGGAGRRGRVALCGVRAARDRERDGTALSFFSLAWWRAIAGHARDAADHTHRSGVGDREGQESGRAASREAASCRRWGGAKKSRALEAARANARGSVLDRAPR